MPGAYAHITMVNECRAPSRLEAAGISVNVCRSAMKWFGFCELGAVSPDYPYLALGDEDSTVWADKMHYDQTGEIFHAGIRRLRRMSGEAASKCTAWLFGYASHLITDATIHPVVELRVGPYADNKTAHRICEMNQDSYIFQRLNLQVQLAEHLAQGIGRCADPREPRSLDPDIAEFWCALLAEVHPSTTRSSPPDPNKWHRGFRRGVDIIAEEGHRLWPIARHLAMDCGLVYPSPGEVNRTYLDRLQTPQGEMSYDDVFNMARGNVLREWSAASAALADTQSGHSVAVLGNWNLDTGRDSATSELVYWRGTA